MNACGKSSWGNKDQATSCMKGKEGYSDTCAACFGGQVACTASQCMSSCMWGETAACKKCVKDHCVAPFETCSGLTPPSTEVAVTGPACTNAADQQVWTSKGQANFDSDMNACGKSSWGNKDQATSCMKGKEGYSDTCAACFGGQIACTASQCMGSCMWGETGACKKCVKDHCDAPFETCSGLTPPSEVKAETGPACTNAADQQVWTSKGQANFDSDMNACGKSSWGNKDQATSCMKGKEG